MESLVYYRHRFHQDIIKGFNLRLPGVQKLMIERGVDILYEKIRSWVDTLRSVYVIYYCEVWQTLLGREGR